VLIVEENQGGWTGLKLDMALRVYDDDSDILEEKK